MLDIVALIEVEATTEEDTIDVTPTIEGDLVIVEAAQEAEVVAWADHLLMLNS